MIPPAIRQRVLPGTLLVAIVLTACAGGTAAGPAASASGAPSGSLAIGSAPASLPASARTAAPSTSGAAPSASGAAVPAVPAAPAVPAVPVDPALLAMLPVSVAGFPLQPIPDPTGLDDPALVASLDRLAQAYAVDPAGSGFAYASVVVLRPGVFSEAFFRSWRDSFDEGACSQAGGVAGHAQAQIGGRTTYIGDCAGGLLTYHVRLESLNAIVSVSSLGGAHLGEQLLAELRP
jgi:hypothetical protein